MTTTNKILLTLALAALIFGAGINGCGGSQNSGVYKSLDNGKSWQELFSKEEGSTLLPPFEVTAMALDRVFTDTLFVGSKNKGMFKTRDGGRTWQAINQGLPKEGKGLEVTALAIDQLSSETIYLACYTSRYGRVYKSENGGQSWKEVYAESKKNAKVLALASDPTNAGVLYLGTSEGGIIKSTTFGESFAALEWYEGQEITFLVVDPINTNIVYAGTDSRYGVIKSNDGGKTWKETGVKKDDKVYATQKKDFQINAITVDPNNPKVVYAGTDQGIYISENSGSDWELVNTLMPPKSGGVFAIAVSPVKSQVIYFSTEKIIYRSVNKGETWETSKLETPGHVRFLSIDPSNPQVIYIGIGSIKAAKKGPLF